MTEEHVIQHWRFWPILCLAFIFSFSSPLVMIATPIYFIQQGVDIIIISLLSTAITITYSVSPVILNKISDKLGRRKSVIIATIGVTCAQLVFYITLNPLIFFIERLFEGIILGFFFPNLQASISDNIAIDHQKYLAKFNLSWSIASVFGLLFGAILMQFINDLKFMFYINPIFLALNAFIAVVFFQEPIINKIETQYDAIDFIKSKAENNQKSVANSSYHIPVIIPLLLILAVTFASGNGSLLYPIKSVRLGFQPAGTYFAMLFSTFTQTLGMYLASLVVLKKLKLLSSFTLLLYAFLFILFTMNEIYFLFIILFMVSGFFFGILYGTASKLFLTLNIVKKTSIYSSISESSIGLFFFVSQIILGIIADIDVVLAYYTITLALIIIFIISFVFIKKLKEI